MHEVISEVPAATSGKYVFAFVALSIGLILVGVGFAYGVFAGISQTILGVLLAAGFAMFAGVIFLYSRMMSSHRVMIERNEDLW